MNLKKRVLFGSIPILILFNLFVWFSVYGKEVGKLEVYFLDVGQGDAVYIKSPNGKDMLIDGGRGRQILSALGGVVDYGDNKIDVVLATHADADHIGGLPFVLDNYEVGLVVDNGSISKTEIFKEFKDKISKEGSKYIKGEEGVKIILDEKDGVEFYILSPEKAILNPSDANAQSIVGKLIYGSSTVLLTGDAPIEIENKLVKKFGRFLSSDVLKLGHHGSRTSTGRDFLSTVSPDVAIVSAGLNNSYGHPHKEVMDLVQELGIKVFKTFESGTIKCVGDIFKIVCE